jgi:hypothetical protein
MRVDGTRALWEARVFLTPVGGSESAVSEIGLELNGGIPLYHWTGPRCRDHTVHASDLTRGVQGFPHASDLIRSVQGAWSLYLKLVADKASDGLADVEIELEYEPDTPAD